MGYTEKYTETIHVPYSKTITFRYPASEHGGTATETVSGTASTDVNVNIYVDSEPLERSVASCNATVDRLTGAVTIAKGAQIATINDNSKRIANGIIGGFFQLIRSEISQQAVELAKSVDASLIHLQQQAKSLIAQKSQMETDYNRLADRYIKTFNDLNHELANRVHQLDRPVFAFKKETDAHAQRMSGNDLVNTVTVLNSENGELQSQISASIAKKRASDTITQAKIFLCQQKMSENAIRQSMFNENISATRFLPVCLLETKDEQEQTGKSLFTSRTINLFQEKEYKDKIINLFYSPLSKWEPLPHTQSERIRMHLNAEIEQQYVNTDTHSARVKKMIHQLAQIESIHHSINS